MKKVLIALVVLALVGGAGALIFVFAGVYNVAATEPHTRLVHWAAQTLVERSVKARADETTSPDLATANIEHGIRRYQELCVMCHGAPGVTVSAIGQGLNPAPPMLTAVAEEFTAPELFWIVRHGIKMTGMPAFGPTQSDPDLWAIVALIAKLPTLSAEDYARALDKSDTHEDTETPPASDDL